MNPNIPSNRTDEAVRRIVGLIREQGADANRRLPSERQLEQQWQLGRSTVNKAVSCLIAQGHLRRVGYKLYPSGFEPGDVQADTRTPPVAPPPIHVIQPPFGPAISHGLFEAAHDVAQSLNTHTIPIISNTAGEQCRQLGKLLRKGTEGFVLWPCPGAPVESLLRQFRAHGVPFVLCDLDLGPFDFVSVDNEQGMRLAVEHLHALGHRRIAYVTQSLQIPSLRRRRDGYIQGCMSLGLRSSLGSIIEMSFASLPESMKEAFDRFRADFAAATAVAFSNDCIAIEFIRMAKEAGVRVPEELSVIGFDDIDYARITTPALTTIAQNFHHSGVVATQLLFHLIDNVRKGRPMSPYRLRIEPQLVIRQSTARRSR